MSETTALEARVKALEFHVKTLERKAAPVPVKKDPRIILCSWAAAPVGAGVKCGWRGRADKYQKHLVAKHGGEEYKAPKTGLPATGD